MWVAQRIGDLYASAVVGVLLLATVAFNLSMLPYPAWFNVAILIAVPVAIVAGVRWARAGAAAAPVADAAR